MKFCNDIHQSSINPILNLLPQVQIIELILFRINGRALYVKYLNGTSSDVVSIEFKKSAESTFLVFHASLLQMGAITITPQFSAVVGN